MLKFITLTMSVGFASPAQETDDVGEDDGIASAPERVEQTRPIRINVAQIRDFYPRKEPLVGTRILFNNGSAVAVTEPFGDVVAKVDAACAEMAS
jgi:hypothetical protein